MRVGRLLTQQGFSLIELLIITAVMGLLAALVLASITVSRNKADDARVKSGVGQLRRLAEDIFAANNGVYLKVGAGNVATCFSGGATSTDTNCTSALTHSNADSLYDSIAVANDVTPPVETYVGGTGTSLNKLFCIEARMKSVSTNYHCADSSGATRTNAAASCAADISCN